MRSTAVIGVMLALGLAACPSGKGGGNGADGGITDGGGGGNGQGDGGPQGGDSGTPVPADVEVVITSDNAFSFGYGDIDSLDTFIQGEPSGGPSIFNCPIGYGPHAYTVPGQSAPDSAYLYIIAWADQLVTQGTLARFTRVGSSTSIYSGDGNWEVCATGDEYDGGGSGPTSTVINEWIGECNKASTGNAYSKGWVNTLGSVSPGAIGRLAYGELNDNAGGSFPIVCQSDDGGVRGIDAEAKWMWFDPQDAQNPFVGNTGNRTKTFLIFRLPADVLTIN